MLILLPSCLYFIYAGLYYTFDKYNLFPKYKINSNIDYNISEILTRVINTQLIQLFLAYVTDSNERSELKLNNNTENFSCDDCNGYLSIFYTLLFTSK